MAEMTQSGLSVKLDHLPKCKGINIKFKDIEFTVPLRDGQGKRKILHSVSGEFRPGELTAVMGASGAGKTTLVNILAGSIKENVKGDILVDNVKRELRKFRKMSCYIMQFDALCVFLSVAEVMDFTARLKLGDDVIPKEREIIINNVLDAMNLSLVGDRSISCLSSGERKRLVIALELLNNPPVMFFDEPTTGLDSFSCLQCVSLMKSLSRSGRTVICVIHQPSSHIFNMFDKVYLMAEGQCIYDGAPGSALLNFFSDSLGFQCPKDHNPADFAIEVAIGKYGYVVHKLVETNKMANMLRYGEEDNKEKKVESVMLTGPSVWGEVTPSSVAVERSDEVEEADFNPFGASFWTQFTCLYKRSIQCTTRDITLTHIRILATILVGILTAMLYSGFGKDSSKLISNMNLLFFVQVIVVFTAMMATVLTFPQEMPIVAREHLNNWYTLKAYFLAKWAADLPMEVVYPSSFLVLVYFVTEQPLEASRFFMFWTTGVMTSFVAQSIGLAIGIIFTIQIGALLCVMSIAFSVLFCGFMVPLNALPPYLRLFCYADYLKYSLQSTVTSIYGLDRQELNCSQPYCIFRSPSSVFEEFGIPESDFVMDMLVLAGFLAFARLTAFFLLRRKIRSASSA